MLALRETHNSPLNPLEIRIFVSEIRINGLDQHVIRSLSVQPACLVQGKGEVDPEVHFLALRAQASPAPKTSQAQQSFGNVVG